MLDVAIYLMAVIETVMDLNLIGERFEWCNTILYILFAKVDGYDFIVHKY